MVSLEIQSEIECETNQVWSYIVLFQLFLTLTGNVVLHFIYLFFDFLINYEFHFIKAMSWGWAEYCLCVWRWNACCLGCLCTDYYGRNSSHTHSAPPVIAKTFWNYEYILQFFLQFLKTHCYLWHVDVVEDQQINQPQTPWTLNP